VSTELAATAAGILGLVTGVLAVAAFWYSDRVQRQAPPVESEAPGLPPVSEGLARILGVLPGAAFVVGADGAVLRSSAPAITLGLVRGDRIAIPEIAALVGPVRRDGVIRELDLELARPPGPGVLRLRARAAPLSSETVLLLVEDLSEAVRVDAVRRDFVANVSHELKTPVGAISLLSEAIVAASDEPIEVRRFAARMQSESFRLTNLVNDLIDLSRLQGADLPTDSQPVSVTDLMVDAAEATRFAAQAREIDVVVGPAPEVVVHGDEGQLLMALRNLLTNAIAYSPAGTKIAVSGRLAPAAAGGTTVVEIGVIDQGIGIPAAEQTRIFERFYRVDPARSRITGGTGLGLAIVKHVCVNHGGECTVWSVPGEGSTFTLRLPVHHGNATAPAVADPSVAGADDPMTDENAAIGRADKTRERVT
jgi:two-component system, OmpR family, sensor histidine kinase SenX3